MYFTATADGALCGTQHSLLALVRIVKPTFRGSDERSMVVALSGRCRIHVHYFEDGNIHRTDGFDRAMDLKIGTNTREIATAVLNAIAKAEGDFQKDAEVTNEDSLYFFKSFRRVEARRRRTTIDWWKVAQYRVGNSEPVRYSNPPTCQILCPRSSAVGDIDQAALSVTVYGIERTSWK